MYVSCQRSGHWWAHNQCTWLLLLLLLLLWMNEWKKKSHKNFHTKPCVFTMNNNNNNNNNNIIIIIIIISIISERVKDWFPHSGNSRSVLHCFPFPRLACVFKGQLSPRNAGTDRYQMKWGLETDWMILHKDGQRCEPLYGYHHCKLAGQGLFFNIFFLK